MEITTTTWLVLTCGALVFSAPSDTSCTPCPPGFGVLRTCSPRDDTTCIQCLPGTYSSFTDSQSPCRPCSRCGQDFFELQPCGPIRDVVCRVCSGTKALGNPDYNRKCGRQRPSETPLARARSKAKRKPIGGSDYTLNKFIESDHYDVPDFDPPVSDQQDFQDTAPIFSAEMQPERETDPRSSTEEGDVAGSKPDSEWDEQHGEGSYAQDNEDEFTQESDPSEGFVQNSRSTLKNTIVASTETTYDPDDEVFNGVEPAVEDGASVTASVTEVFLRSTDNTLMNTDLALERKAEEEDGSGSTEEMSGDFDPITERETLSRLVTTGKRGEWTAGPEQGKGEKSQTTETGLIRPTEEMVSNSKMKEGGTEEDRAEDEAEGATETTSSSTVSIFGVCMAALTAGSVFLAVGFFCSRGRGRHRGYNLRRRTYQRYERAAVEPIHTFMKANNDYELVEMSPPGNHTTTFTRSKSAHDQNETEAFIRATRPANGYQYKSSVNIVPDDIELDEMLEKNPLCIHYTTDKALVMTNIGTTLKVAVDGSPAGLQGGPLGEHKYQLSHIHFHWGASDDSGSEHTVNGKSYPCEMHMVNWNAEDYNSFAEAAKSEDGLAVLAVFLKVGQSRDNSALAQITNCLSKVKFKGESCALQEQSFNLFSLLPANTADYWTYNGTLTTPHCGEAVTWIIFKEPIEVSSKQLTHFRQLRSHEKDERHGDSSGEDGGPLVNSFRPTQPLQNSAIRSSFL